MTLDQRPPGPVEPFPDDTPEPPFDPEPTGATPAFRPVPADIAAEQYVLGAALLDPTQVTNCTRLLTAADFRDPKHEAIWRAITWLHADGQPTEPQAVAARLLDSDAGAFRRIGGPGYLFELIEACAIPASAPYYASRVETLARRRAAITTMRRELQRLEQPGHDEDVDQVLATVATNMADARDSLANLTAPTTWSPVDLGTVLSGEYLDPPPTMLQRSDGVFLLYDGAVHTIAGESESGKTWLTLIAALQLIQTDQRVVFVDFEDRADRVIGRLMALGGTVDQIRANFSYVRPDRPLDDDGRAQLAPHITGAQLVILDGVTEAMTMHGFDLNSNADSALFQGLLPRWIADHGPAVVMIDHVVKDKEKQGRFALGAQHKLAGIDGVAYLVTMIQPFARGKRGLARVDVGKDRPGHVREHARGKTIAEFSLDSTASDVSLIAHLMPPSAGTDGQADTFEPTFLMERISRAVQATPGMSKKAIEDLVNGKTSTKRTALELLVTRGYIGTKQASRGRIEHFHAKPYYDPQGDPNDSDAPPQDPSETEEEPWHN